MHAPFFLLKKWQVLILNSDINIETEIVMNLSFWTFKESVFGVRCM